MSKNLIFCFKKINIKLYHKNKLNNSNSLIEI